MRILALVDHEFEDLELWYPVLRLQEEEIVVDLVGAKEKQTYYGKYGVPAVSDYSYTDVDAENYDGILVPGGWAPDKLRRSPEVIRLIQEMNEMKKPIGQICHAGWVLISAQVVKGVKVTSTPGIRDDLENAGAIWFDKPVVTDGHIISARRPPDLPLYMKEYLRVLDSNR